jgi:hypothetical protein
VKRKLGMSEEVPGRIFGGQARANTETEKLSELSETSLVWLEGQVDKKIEGESWSTKRCTQAGRGLGKLGLWEVFGWSWPQLHTSPDMGAGYVPTRESLGG